MNTRYEDYGYVAATVALTVYGQLVLKYRMRDIVLPADALDKVRVLVLAIFDPAIFSCFVAGFAASLTWMAAMSRLDLSHAYPFTSHTFVFVLVLSGWLLSEPITVNKVVGIALIVAGTVVAARG
jgi:drug/metabolite transporter (DMT)-like permease